MSESRLLDSVPDTTKRIAWIVFLTLASLGFSYIFACAAPFAALATLAALNVRRSDAYGLVVLVWLANQAVGYGLLHYPQTWDSYGWGFAIGLAALLATQAVLLLGPHPRRMGTVLGTLVGFLAAFAVYELALYAASFLLPSSDAAFSLPIVWYIFKVNAAALAGLVALSLAAGAIGMTSSVTLAPRG